MTMNRPPQTLVAPVAVSAAIQVTTLFCIPDDQQRHLPKRRRAPDLLPPNVPIPRHGDVVYLSPTSAWGVHLVIHDWRTDGSLQIEIWLEHLSNSRHPRPSGFALLSQ